MKSNTQTTKLQIREVNKGQAKELFDIGFHGYLFVNLWSLNKWLV